MVTSVLSCFEQDVRALIWLFFLVCCKGSKFGTELIEVFDQVIILIHQLHVFFRLIGIGHGIYFPCVLTDIVLEIVQVDELNMKLVVEMFNLY